MRRLLFIPSYNCERQLIRVLESLDRSHLSSRFEEIIVIDNRSTDRTREVALDWSDRHPQMGLRVEQNPVNLGLGGSHKRMFLRALQRGYDEVVVLHGDDQAEIADFRDVLGEPGPGGKHVFGARFMSTSRRSGYSRIKTLGNLFFCGLSSLVLRRPIPDFGGSGLNLFSMSLIRQGRWSSRFIEFPDNLTFHVFFLLAAWSDRQPIEFRPISWKEEDQVSNVKAFRQGIFLIRLLMRFLWCGPGVLGESRPTLDPRLYETQ